jgi:hypothetical protein
MYLYEKIEKNKLGRAGPSPPCHAFISFHYVSVRFTTSRAGFVPDQIRVGFRAARQA